MAFEIAIHSALPHSFYDAREWADLTAGSPVVDFGKPMAKFRTTLLLKAGTGGQTFALQLADDEAFTQNVRTITERRTLSTGDESMACGYHYAVRGGQRYGRITCTGGGGAIYDARLEWSDAR